MRFPLSLMCVLAHPDDESLGVGFTLAKYSAEGVFTSIVMATRGERGWQGNPHDNPGPQALGRVREVELLASADVLGVAEVNFLDYMDGDLDQANPAEICGKIAAHIRRVRPDVLVTFDPFGAYGHPDHIAISQFALGAVMLSAGADFADPTGNPPHQVSKVYFMVDSEPLVEMYTALVGVKINMEVDGNTRVHTSWPAWAASARIDATDYWDTAVEAIGCHKTQVQGIIDLIRLIPERFEISTWAVQPFYRAFSLVNSGRKLETDLFEGLR